MEVICTIYIYLSVIVIKFYVVSCKSVIGRLETRRCGDSVGHKCFAHKHFWHCLFVRFPYLYSCQVQVRRWKAAESLCFFSCTACVKFVSRLRTVGHALEACASPKRRVRAVHHTATQFVDCFVRKWYHEKFSSVHTRTSPSSPVLMIISSSSLRRPESLLLAQQT